MGYTPTTWATGDTVTASALNKIENGIANAGSVASVTVDFRNGGMSGSVFCFIGYAKFVTGEGFYSIESMLEEHYTSTTTGYLRIPVCLASSEDDLAPFAFFSYNQDSQSAYTITGNISTTKVQGNVKVGDGAWASGAYYGFEILGDGKIAVAYAD